MPRAWTSDRAAAALWSVALALAIAAAALVAWPARPHVPELRRAAAPRPPAPPRPDAPLADAGVRVDVFAAGHVPPRTRWAPPPIDTLPPGLAPDPAAAASLAGASAAADPPRFYGTVVDARGAAALLRFPSAGESRLYHAGDRASGWRVLAVSPERVTVAAPGGTRLTLRLPRRDARSDTTTVP